MQWQIRRGFLAPAGSPWWRATNEDLIRVTAEARYLAGGAGGQPSAPAVIHGVEFIAQPTARGWYRAHNTAIATAYLDHRGLAAQEGRVERFFLNLVLLRVLYAHALVAAPRLALGWLAPLSPESSSRSRGCSRTAIPSVRTSGTRAVIPVRGGR